MRLGAPYLRLVPDTARPRVLAGSAALGTAVAAVAQAGGRPAPGLMPSAPARPAALPRPGPSPRRPLGQILLEMKAVDPGDMLKALALRDRQEARLGDILLAHGWVSDADLMTALTLQWGSRALDLLAEPPDPRLLDRVGAETCLTEGLLPWRRIGGATVIATARPEDFARARALLPRDLCPVVMALAPEADIHAALVSARQTRLIRKAETRVAAAESCRGHDAARSGRRALAAVTLLAAAALAAPVATFAVLTGWAVLTLVAFTGLKLAAFIAEARAVHRRPAAAAPPPLAIARLPVVSVMVPLFREHDIAPRLIHRLGRIDYPKELFDVLLLVEEDDHATRAALARHRLPRWMRVITIPAGPIRTKPRALNYGLDFCRGSIVGVYDAEDAPEPAQIHRIVRRFHERGPEVACLQGILDYYNARHNWLSRCFTIEYAAWFRAMLPGLARLGLVVPLGGTTLFFRRPVLEALGGWDAHNVTEDADLGLRLARRGYRTELVDTVTEEEPNARLLPWIRQRSRWQKGFWMTWASHMRDPGQLLRDLGPRRFFGVQVLFLGSLSQALLAPVLWSFWALALGLPHPLRAVVPEAALAALAGLFVLSETVSILVGIWAVRGPGHRHLVAWVPTLHLYFPLAALASWKALHEAVTRPFYWDKTTHGLLDGAGAPAETGATETGAIAPPLLLGDPVWLPGAPSRPADARTAAIRAPGLAEAAAPAPQAPAPQAPVRQAPVPQEWKTSTPPPASTGAAPAPVLPPIRTRRAKITAPGRLHLGAPAPRPAPWPRGSAVAEASRRPGIEFQPCFEGFGDM